MIVILTAKVVLHVIHVPGWIAELIDLCEEEFSDLRAVNSKLSWMRGWMTESPHMARESGVLTKQVDIHVQQSYSVHTVYWGETHAQVRYTVFTCASWLPRNVSLYVPKPTSSSHSHTLSTDQVFGSSCMKCCDIANAYYAGMQTSR